MRQEEQTYSVSRVLNGLSALEAAGDELTYLLAQSLGDEVEEVSIVFTTEDDDGGGGGVTDHTQLSNIGTLTHDELESALGDLEGAVGDLEDAVDDLEALTWPIMVACSDMTTAIVAATGVVTFRAPFAGTITKITASLAVASSSGTPTFDVNVNGSTILSTKLTVDANERTSETAATPAVISSGTLALDDEITVDIDVAGTGTKGVVLTFRITR